MRSDFGLQTDNSGTFMLFDVCVTVLHEYNDVNIQQDVTTSSFI